MRAFVWGALILLAGCQSILGIDDTTLRLEDAPPPPDAPLPPSPDAPLTFDGPPPVDARPQPDGPLPADAAPPPDGCFCSASSECGTATPICDCKCRTCSGDPECAARATEVGGNQAVCVQGKCVECRGDSDCGGANPTCDVLFAGGTCVAPAT